MSTLITMLVVIPLFCVVASFWIRIVQMALKRFVPDYRGFRIKVERRGDGGREAGSGAVRD